METISEKLTYLNGTKSKIKDAVNHEYELIDDTTTFREYADKIKDIEYNIKEYIPSKSVTDAHSVEIDDAVELIPSSFQVNGSSKQDSTNGNQLIDFNNLASNTTANYTFENDILKVTSIGGNYNRVDFDLLGLIKSNPGKTLYFKCDAYDFSNGTSPSVNIQKTIDGTDTYNSLMLYTGSFTSYTIPTDVSGITSFKVRFVCNNTSASDNSSIASWTKPILSFTENADYEPYTGGVASPNPDYPQEIVSASGKNIIPTNRDDYTVAGLANGVITLSSSVFKYRLVPTKMYPIKPNTTYIISIPTGTRLGVHTYDKSGNFLKDTGWQTNGKTFTTDSTAVYFRSVWSSYSSTNETEEKKDFTEENINKYLSSVQIEEGTTATNYEPHNSIKLENISENLFNYADTNTLGNAPTTITGTSDDFTISADKGTYGMRIYCLGLIDFTTLYRYMSSIYVEDSIYIYVANSCTYSSFTDYSNDRTKVGEMTSSTTDLSSYQGKYLWVQLRGNGGKYISVNYKDFVLTKEPIKTLYLPLGTQPLRGIGDYKDKLIVNTRTGAVSRTNYIKEITLDGSENWINSTVSEITGTFRGQILDTNTFSSIKSQPSYNSHFVARTTEPYTYYKEYSYITEYSLFIQLASDRLSSATLAAFKTWLSENKPIVDYVLSTPTIEEIGMLTSDELRQLKLFLKKNNISIDDDLATFDMSYFVDYNSLINT